MQLRQRRFGIFERRELRLDLGRIGRQPIQRGLGSLHLGGGRGQLGVGRVALRILISCVRSVEVVGGLLELQALGPGAGIRRALDPIVGRLRLVARGVRVVALRSQGAQLLGIRAGAHPGVILLRRGQCGLRCGPVRGSRARAHLVIGSLRRSHILLRGCHILGGRSLVELVELRLGDGHVGRGLRQLQRQLPGVKLRQEVAGLDLCAQSDRHRDDNAGGGQAKRGAAHRDCLALGDDLAAGYLGP